MLSRVSRIKSIIDNFQSFYDIETLIHTSVLSVVREFFPHYADKECWAFFCAIINKQAPVIKWLIPMLSALAVDIEQKFEGFRDFIISNKKDQLSILSRFKWHRPINTGEIEKIGWKHRLISIDKLIIFLSALRRFILKNGSLKSFVEKEYNKNQKSPRIESLIRKLSEEMIICSQKEDQTERLESPIQGTLIPHPKSPSAFKTLNLFFRWMVRPYPDLELWTFIKPSDLIIPLDVGILRVIERLELIKNPKDTWNYAVEITKLFSKHFNSKDPVSVDFPLSRLGITGLCKKEIRLSNCKACVFGTEGVCPSAISPSEKEKTYSNLFKNINTQKYNKLKGEYLEGRIRELLLKLGYVPDQQLKYISILNKKVSQKLVKSECLKIGLRTEYDVVGIKKLHEEGKYYFIVVECKYHSKPISDKEIKCFSIKSDYLNEYIMDRYGKDVALIKDKWFVSLTGFTTKAENIATSLSIKQIDAKKLNKLLAQHNLPALLNIN